MVPRKFHPVNLISCFAVSLSIRLSQLPGLFDFRRLFSPQVYSSKHLRYILAQRQFAEPSCEPLSFDDIALATTFLHGLSMAMISSSKLTPKFAAPVVLVMSLEYAPVIPKLANLLEAYRNHSMTFRVFRTESTPKSLVQNQLGARCCDFEMRKARGEIGKNGRNAIPTFETILFFDLRCCLRISNFSDCVFCGDLARRCSPWTINRRSIL